jgi:hypothetical protein
VFITWQNKRRTASVRPLRLQDPYTLIGNLLFVGQRKCAHLSIVGTLSVGTLSGRVGLCAPLAWVRLVLTYNPEGQWQSLVNVLHASMERHLPQMLVQSRVRVVICRLRQGGK